LRLCPGIPEPDAASSPLEDRAMSRRCSVIVGIVTALALTVVLAGCDQALSVVTGGSISLSKSSAEKHRFFEDSGGKGGEKVIVIPKPGLSVDPTR
jgi:hypothetical protein